jgi:hypothetical protein
MKLIAVAVLCVAGLSLAAEPKLSPNAPPDRTGKRPVAELDEALAPLVVGKFLDTYQRK